MLTFHRQASAGSDVLLRVEVYRRDGKLYVTGTGIPKGIAYQVNLSLLATLMKSWQ